MSEADKLPLVNFNHQWRREKGARKDKIVSIFYPAGFSFFCNFFPKIQNLGPNAQ